MTNNSKIQDVSEESIRMLVDTFYLKVRSDVSLNPIFTQAIGESLDEWKPHLQIMYDFWSSLVLGSGRYRGNPFKKHLALPSFDVSLFDRWLKLFEETALEVHVEKTAHVFIAKSRQIAQSLKMGLYPALFV